MGIKWFRKDMGKSYVTVYSTNITVSKSISKYLTSFYAALLGADRENKEVIMKFLTRNEADDYSANDYFVLSSAVSYTRVSSTAFVSYLGNLIGYDFHNGSRKYLCSYDDSNAELHIYLDKEIKK